MMYQGEQMLRYIALIVLHYVALCYITLRYVALRYVLMA